MKKKVLALALACAACLTLLAGCGGDDKSGDTVTLKVGASPAPPRGNSGAGGAHPG